MPREIGQPITLPFRRVLLTGGTGFVGRHLLPRLLTALGSTATLYLAGREIDRPEVAREFETVEFDLADAASIHTAIGTVRPDLIVHLAGEASVGAAAKNAASTWRLNTLAALEIASAVAAHAPDVTMLNISSAEVYGQAFLAGRVSEDTPPIPTSIYAQSKLAAEQILLHAMPPGSKVIVARPSNHIGPGQDQRFAMPAFAAQIAAMEVSGGKTIRVGNLESRRDFMDVRDVVDAYLALLAIRLDPGVRAIFNISSGRALSVRSLLEMMRAYARVETITEVDADRFRPAEIPLAEVDSSRLREATGWAPTIPIEQSVADVLDDWRARWKD